MIGDAGEVPLRFSAHALRQMFARAITAEDIRHVLTHGETIADYPSDTPYPSRLILGFVGGRPLHVVLAESADDIMGVIVTAYEPAPALWEPGFRERKKP